MAFLCQLFVVTILLLLASASLSGTENDSTVIQISSEADAMQPLLSHKDDSAIGSAKSVNSDHGILVEVPAVEEKKVGQLVDSNNNASFELVSSKQDAFLLKTHRLKGVALGSHYVNFMFMIEGVDGILGTLQTITQHPIADLTKSTAFYSSNNSACKLRDLACSPSGSTFIFKACNYNSPDDDCGRRLIGNVFLSSSQGDTKAMDTFIPNFNLNRHDYERVQIDTEPVTETKSCMDCNKLKKKEQKHNVPTETFELVLTGPFSAYEYNRKMENFFPKSLLWMALVALLGKLFDPNSAIYSMIAVYLVDIITDIISKKLAKEMEAGVAPPAIIHALMGAPRGLFDAGWIRSKSIKHQTNHKMSCKKSRKNAFVVERGECGRPFDFASKWFSNEEFSVKKTMNAGYLEREIASDEYLCVPSSDKKLLLIIWKSKRAGSTKFTAYDMQIYRETS